MADHQNVVGSLTTGRKRKIRCVISTGDSLCVSCKNKGLQCTEQRRNITMNDRGSTKLKDRVAKLEAMIERLASGDNEQLALESDKATTGPPRVCGEVATSESSTSEEARFSKLSKITHKKISASQQESSAEPNLNTTSRYNGDPIESLFDNAIWQRQNAGQPIDQCPRIQGPVEAPNSLKEQRRITKRVRTREALLSGLPASEILGPILIETSNWFKSWRPLGMENGKRETLPTFILRAFNSDDPALVGQAVLSVAISITQLSAVHHSHLLSKLPRPPGEICHDLFEKVDRLVINDSDYGGTKDGIEVMAMSASIFVNFGLIKKGWGLIHRAISHAQILGYHRPCQLHAKETQEEIQLRQKSFLMLCQKDMFLSLVLGLPYASDAKTIPKSISEPSGSAKHFQHELIGFSARVIDRNQMGQGLSIPATQEIEEDLNIMSQQMSIEFWDVSAVPTEKSLMRYEYLERITGLFWFQQLRVCLYMPLMFRSVEDTKLGEYRVLCLGACRDLLRVYDAMRSDSAFKTLNIIDYQAFLCASLIILGLLGYGSSESDIDGENPLEVKDREIVRITIDTLKVASTTSNNTIAAQAVQGLETLEMLQMIGPCPQVDASGNCLQPTVTIIVPYTGTIAIAPGSFLMKRRQNMSRENSVNNGSASQSAVGTLASGMYNASQNIKEPHQGIQAGKPGGAVDGIESIDSQRNLQHQETNMMADFGTSIELDWESLVNLDMDMDGYWDWVSEMTVDGVPANI